MKVTILGAVIKKGHTKVQTMRGAQYLPVRDEYHDDEILELTERGAGVFGRHWIYAGDQGFKESNIHVEVELDDGAKETKVFAGRTGLNDMIKYLDEKGLSKQEK